MGLVGRYERGFKWKQGKKCSRGPATPSLGCSEKKRTLLSLVYLVAGSACGLLDLILFSFRGLLVWGLVAIPLWDVRSFPLDLSSSLKIIGILIGGALVIPITASLCFFPALLEHRLAGVLLNIGFLVGLFWTIGGSCLTATARHLLSEVAWKRLLFGMVRIPLGFVSFLRVVTLLPAAFAMLTTLVAYLVGLAVGWRTLSGPTIRPAS